MVIQWQLGALEKIALQNTSTQRISFQEVLVNSKDLEAEGEAEMDGTTVHHACGIFRTRIFLTGKIKRGILYSLTEMGLESQKKFVDPHPPPNWVSHG